jgi:hypothetical protein
MAEPQVLAKNALVTVAILKVDFDTNRDFLAHFVPLVEHVLVQEGLDAFAVEQAAACLEDAFGLNIPTGVVGTLLKRLVQQGKLAKGHGVYTRTQVGLGDGFESKLQEARRRQKHAVDTLIDFVSRKFGKQWDEARALSVLVSYLGRFSIECLRSLEMGSALPEFPSVEGSDLFMVNAFVIEAQQRDQVSFENISMFVKGYMLSNALLCPDVGAIGRKFDRVVFYLDTPLVLRLLGLEGETRQKAVTEVIRLVRSLGGGFAVFSHTGQEVERVIQWAERHLDTPNARSHVVQEMRRAGKTQSDLAIVRNRMDKWYVSQQIRVERTPDHEIRFHIDEALLQDAILDEMNYGNDRAIDYDVDSIRSVYSLRRGREPARVEDAVAVLVTSNDTLARVAREFGRKERSSREVSSVITDFGLANYAWLKSPSGAPHLPLIEMNAVAYAAMEPPPHLWQKYLQELDRLGATGEFTADDLAVLRYSGRAQRELMDLTQGNEDDLSEVTIKTILDRIDRDHAEDREKVLAAERARHEAMLGEKDQALQVANDAIASGQSMIDRLVERRRDQRRMVEAQCDTQGKLAANIATTCVSCLLITAYVLVLVNWSWLESQFGPIPKAVHWVTVFLATLVLAVATFFNWGWGVSVVSLRGWLTCRLGAWLLARRRRTIPMLFDDDLSPG